MQKFRSVKNFAKSAWQTAKERVKEFWKFDRFGINIEDSYRSEASEVIKYLEAAYSRHYSASNGSFYIEVDYSLMAIRVAREIAAKHEIRLLERKLARRERKICKVGIKEALEFAKSNAKFIKDAPYPAFIINTISGDIKQAEGYAKQIGLDISKDVAKIERIAQESMAQRKRSVENTA